MSFTQTVNEEGSCIAEPCQTQSATCAVDAGKDLKTKLTRRPVTTPGAATSLYEGRNFFFDKLNLTWHVDPYLYTSCKNIAFSLLFNYKLCLGLETFKRHSFHEAKTPAIHSADIEAHVACNSARESLEEREYL